MIRRMMSRVRYGCLGSCRRVLLMALIVVSGQSVRAGNEEAEERLPDVDGVPISKGYVVYDGKYLEPPYVVSSRDGMIAVNGVWERKAGEWPPFDWTVDELPTLPAWVDENTQFHELTDFGDRRTNYLAKVHRFYRMQFPELEAYRLIAQKYRELPFVKSVESRSEGRQIELTFLNNDTLGCGLAPFSPNSLPLYLRPTPSKQQIEAGVEQERQAIEQIVQRGGVLLLHDNEFGNGNYDRLAGREVAIEFPILLKIAASDMTDDQKLTELDRLEIAGIYNYPKWRGFIRKLSVPENLLARTAAFGDPDRIFAERDATIRRMDDYRRKRKERSEKLRAEEAARKRAKEANAIQ